MTFLEYISLDSFRYMVDDLRVLYNSRFNTDNFDIYYPHYIVYCQITGDSLITTKDLSSYINGFHQYTGLAGSKKFLWDLFDIVRNNLHISDAVINPYQFFTKQVKPSQVQFHTTFLEDIKKAVFDAGETISDTIWKIGLPLIVTYFVLKYFTKD